MGAKRFDYLILELFDLLRGIVPKRQLMLIPSSSAVQWYHALGIRATVPHIAIAKCISTDRQIQRC